jgi:hypothetical protein
MPCWLRQTFHLNMPDADGEVLRAGLERFAH